MHKDHLEGSQSSVSRALQTQPMLSHQENRSIERTMMATKKPRITSTWKIDDFETGYILLAKGDREVVYVAKKKSETKPIITSIREINKRGESRSLADAQIKATVTFLSKVKHRNLL